jgi:hypothetical protein
VVGAGAIGGWSVQTLAKLGFNNITVYDFDCVEIENIGSQPYRFCDIGDKKVHALYDIVDQFADVKIEAYDAMFDDKIDIDKFAIVIMAVDNMKTRALAFDMYKRSFVQYFIDVRMAAEFAVGYVLDKSMPSIATNYADTLYSDETAKKEPCTAKATVYTSTLIGGMVAKIVKDTVMKSPDAIRGFDWFIDTNHLMTYKKTQG